MPPVKQRRFAQRYQPARREDEGALTQAHRQLAGQYGRYVYRRIKALLKRSVGPSARTAWSVSGLKKS